MIQGGKCPERRYSESEQMSDDRPSPQNPCANCGTSLADRYCTHCGQDAHVTLSIRHFIDEFLEGMFHFDSTFWRTFMPLLFRPGFLTAQYLSGKRKLYAPPLRSYLVLSLLYFVIASLVSPSHIRVVGVNGKELKVQNCAQLADNATWLRHLVPDVKASCERALNDEGHFFSNAVAGTLPKVMFVVLPLVALIQYWLNRRQRRWYVENLIFILHFQSFYFLAGSLALLLVACLAVLFKSVDWQSDSLTGTFDSLLYAWSAYYLYSANRLAYRTSAFKAVLSVAAIAVAYTVFWASGVAIAALYEFAHA
jgi:hypothetical protein